MSITLEEKPVFVLGFHRSGTTMLMLDDRKSFPAFPCQRSPGTTSVSALISTPTGS